ncbi:hypothetical protein JD844_031918 [Phrynosoma platyrhinos]|uniref:DDE Tnp4 domain-containing protein n=1 Tax=Phrynosoma platyrhinos TaxID=52577 RepID=A0ABQ7T401_PHRPL|nr:hypothetical protein JD844_031918 [Phrynosoma platyrhinos]
MRKLGSANFLKKKSVLEVYVNEDEDVAVDDRTVDWQMRGNDDGALNSFSYVGVVTRFRSAMQCFYEPMPRRWTMPVEKQIAIAVYFLAHKGSYVTIATIFGVGKSTGCKAITQVVIAMELVLLKKIVYLGDYRKGVLHPHQAVYNKHHNRVRNVVERAFGLLKACWRCLTALLEMAEKNINSVIAACVILHNVVEIDGEVLTSHPPRPAVYVVNEANFLPEG